MDKEKKLCDLENCFPFVVLELKNEFSLEGDATLQAALSYSKIVAMNEWRKSTNVPVILIGLMGDFLEIAGAVFAFKGEETEE
ncbi:hypothetical protein WOLCODRAFT_157497 [Wolfiporia cocos MD-104 SS10]|uniref:Uncharacterized protein n=1 Tax=Wolfiporia cocos (strain MD-104) TaxID=742152 RepID=A0A2H3JGI8_WOLCO|nr:hypothetical protein WOLCODRAFT_157497 [Wolfiporia cocos MD-104 SS10]